MTISLVISGHTEAIQRRSSFLQGSNYRLSETFNLVQAKLLLTLSKKKFSIPVGFLTL